MASFKEMLEAMWRNGRYLCVGLDSEYEKIPDFLKKEPVAEALFSFNRDLIEATAGYSAAYKPNIAFYEGYGLPGLEALIKTNRFIRENYPEHLIILDAKRADIGSTNYGYVKAAFEVFNAHAVTVHPYLGKEALMPFLEKKQSGVIVLCHTSNPGAGEFQELSTGLHGEKLFKVVAAKVACEWNFNDNCALVAGATFPEELGEIRSVAGEIPLLIPGIGAQGGDLAKTVRYGLVPGRGGYGTGIIINASRSIIYASSGRDFAMVAASEAERLDREIRNIVKEVNNK